MLPPIPRRRKRRELAAEAAARAGATDSKPEADAGDWVKSVYLITSPGAQRAFAELLLELCRGHWKIENLNHRERDYRHGEDACLMRTGNGPTNCAALRNMALAVIFRSRDPDRDKHLDDTRVRLQLERDQAIRALTEP